MAESEDPIGDAIDQAAIDGIKRASGDQGSVEKYSIDELIRADEWRRRRAAASSGGWGSLRTVKFIPPPMTDG